MCTECVKESVTGQHVAGDPVGRTHCKAYRRDLEALRKLTDATIGPYHAPIIEGTRRAIATWGSVSAFYYLFFNHFTDLFL